VFASCDEGDVAGRPLSPTSSRERGPTRLCASTGWCRDFAVHRHTPLCVSPFGSAAMRNSWRLSRERRAASASITRPARIPATTHRTRVSEPRQCPFGRTAARAGLEGGATRLPPRSRTYGWVVKLQMSESPYPVGQSLTGLGGLPAISGSVRMAMFQALIAGQTVALRASFQTPTAKSFIASA
jgi:hypothetical protein